MNARKVMKDGKEVWTISIGARLVGRRLRLFRATKKEVEQAAKDEIEKAKQHGSDLGRVSTEERAFLIKWRGKFTSWDEASRILSEHVKGASTPISEVVSRYLNAPRESPMSDRHRSDLISRLGAFETEFGERSVSSLSAGELESYVKSKGASSPNHFRVLRGLLNFAVRHDMISVNPILKTERPVVVPEEKGTFTPEQMAKALRICTGLETGVYMDNLGHPIKKRSEPMIRILIAGGFCGLRRSEIMRLDCAQIDAERGEVHITKMKTQRTGVRERYVEPPENAKEWLRWLQLPKSGPFITVPEISIRRRREALALTLRIKWPHNVLRRSFASYHLASFENAEKTAALLGHTDAQTTHSKYRVARRKEIADAWFALTPSAVLT